MLCIVRAGSHKARRQELVPFGPNAPLSEYDHPRNPDDGFYTLDGLNAMPSKICF
jgi:hypothetical protein